MTLAWLTFIAVATYRWEKNGAATLPPPRIYLGSAVLFSVLGATAGPAPGPSALFAWALVVAAGVTGALDPITDANNNAPAPAPQH